MLHALPCFFCFVFVFCFFKSPKYFVLHCFSFFSNHVDILPYACLLYFYKHLNFLFTFSDCLLGLCLTAVPLRSKTVLFSSYLFCLFWVMTDTGQNIKCIGKSIEVKRIFLFDRFVVTFKKPGLAFSPECWRRLILGFVPG